MKPSSKGHPDFQKYGSESWLNIQKFNEKPKMTYLKLIHKGPFAL